MPDVTTTPKLKAALRARMRGVRAAAANGAPDAATRAAANFMAAIDIAPDAVVSVFHSLPDELDTEPLIAALSAKAIAICLPVVTKKNAPLVFRAYKPGDPLIEGAYGVKTPEEGAAIMAPDIVVTPLLAFSRCGGRLGYGGGYYDRTLAQLRKTSTILAVGYAYAAQEVDAAPLSPLDQPTGWVITECEAICCLG